MDTLWSRMISLLDAFISYITFFIRYRSIFFCVFHSGYRTRFYPIEAAENGHKGCFVQKNPIFPEFSF